ncbi:Hypothetical protein LUCI_3434 [Lucifera butyrica]|uniref:Uncharacterized protein n=1 Tax=Lucifera butyrica TaxID=1351585 RepID=A0A498RAH3_9FIRM|nr:Hypothetical protein LUCI_3434 [Lucifera butyrica]
MTFRGKRVYCLMASVAGPFLSRFICLQSHRTGKIWYNITVMNLIVKWEAKLVEKIIMKRGKDI